MRKNNRVVRKLRFPDNFLIKIAVLQAAGRKAVFCAIIFLFCAITFLNALGSKEPGTQDVEATGRVRLVKNGPQFSLVISSEDREWYIESGEREKLMRLQQQIVTVKGKEYYIDMTFAGGRSAGRRYYLKDVKVIKTPV